MIPSSSIVKFNFDFSTLVAHVCNIVYGSRFSRLVIIIIIIIKVIGNHIEFIAMK